MEFYEYLIPAFCSTTTHTPSSFIPLYMSKPTNKGNINNMLFIISPLIKLV